MDARPNVLLLLTDQERYDVTVRDGEGGGARDECPPDTPAVDTPNVDRLADEGVTFTRAYTPISICTSARGSLLSGLYPHNHGMLNNCHEPDAIRANFPDEIPTFGELLAGAGYETTYVGKWHVGRDQTPADFGFRYLGGRDGAHDARDGAFEQYQSDLGVDPDDANVRDPIYVDDEDDPLLVAGETALPPEATLTYYLAERTIERIESVGEGGDSADGRADESPIFHRTDFPGPHHPYLVPEPYASLYDPADVERWESYAETFAGKPAAHDRYRHYRGVADFDWETWAEAVAKYFGFVTFIDEQIGRILDAVDEHPDAGNTLVVHSTDHGDFAGAHRQFNKGPLMYEDTYHIPLVARWPAVIDGGTQCDAFARLLDLMPTFLDVAGVEPPEDVDGRSLIPLFEGETPEDWPQTVFAEYHGDEFGLYSQRMVRDDRYKFVYNGPDVNELYDLGADPAELTNLIDHPDYADVRRELSATLVEWMRETDDPIAMWTRKVLGGGGDASN